MSNYISWWEQWNAEYQFFNTFVSTTSKRSKAFYNQSTCLSNFHFWFVAEISLKAVSNIGCHNDNHWNDISVQVKVYTKLSIISLMISNRVMKLVFLHIEYFLLNRTSSVGSQMFIYLEQMPLSETELIDTRYTIKLHTYSITYSFHDTKFYRLDVTDI